MGTLINAGAIVFGALLGIVFKRGLPDKLQKALMLAMGLGLFVLSFRWFLRDFAELENLGFKTIELLVLLSLVIGTLLGEWWDIDGRLNRFALRVEKKYNLPPLAKGFVAGTLVFCVGAMAIVGPIQDGLQGEMTTLLIKSILDFVTATILAAIFGFGVVFAAGSVLVYQGSIMLLAMWAVNILNAEIILSLSMIGNVLLIAMAIRFMEIKKIRVANMLPSLLIPIVYYVILYLF